MTPEILKDRPLLVVSSIKLALDETARHLERFLKEKITSRVFRKEPTEHFQFDRVFCGIPPAGGAHAYRVGLFAIGSSTCMVANLQDGWNSLAFVVSKQSGKEAYIFKMSDPHVLQSPMNAFTHVVNGSIARRVSVIKEDKWIFHQEGKSLPQEDVRRYKLRLKRDRVTAEYVALLGSKLGFDVGTPEFYRNHKAVYFFEQ